jgi:hypothetical protein
MDSSSLHEMVHLLKGGFLWPRVGCEHMGFEPATNTQGPAGLDSVVYPTGVEVITSLMDTSSRGWILNCCLDCYDNTSKDVAFSVLPFGRIY